jgi:hypothetical protein
MRFSTFTRLGAAIGFALLVACAPSQPVRTFEVEQAGTLVRNTPGLTPGVWYVSYEEPGQPALTKRLSFAQDAVCIVNGVRGECKRSLFEQGLKVTVRGSDEDAGVHVEEMEIDGDSSSAAQENSALPRHHEGEGFSVDFPAGWTVKENDTITTEEYTLTGTSLVAPSERDKTTLDEAKFHIALNQTCPEQDSGKTVIVNGRMLLENEWNGAGAGNLYEGSTYTLPTGNHCAVITFYAHSCNLGPEDCGPKPVQKYDKNALFKTFREILDTLELKS